VCIARIHFIGLLTLPINCVTLSNDNFPSMMMMAINYFFTDESNPQDHKDIMCYQLEMEESEDCLHRKQIQAGGTKVSGASPSL